MAKTKQDPLALQVESSTLIDFSREAMIIYGSAVNEERALPDFRDGLKPIHRKLLWGMYRLGLAHNKPPVKSARIVGEVIGKYSPHGDMSTYQALAAMVLLAEPLVDGTQSNFGSMIDPPAAPRYTETRPTAYSDSVFFNKEYLDVMPYVPNYDESEVEPVILPALLPNLLINGSFGIGYGTTCSIPSFEKGSIIELLQKTKLAPELKDCVKYLVPKSPYGGVPDWEEPRTKEETKAFADMLKLGVGDIDWAPAFSEPSSRSILVTGFPPNLNVLKVIDKLAEWPEISSVEDKSDRKSGEIRFLVTMKTPDIVDDVIGEFCSTLRVRMNITKREEFVHETTGLMDYKVSFFSAGVVDVLTRWVHWRKQLELKRLALLLQKASTKIEELDLLLLAIANKDKILKALESEQPLLTIKKALKITEEQAEYVGNLRIISLSKLNADKLTSSKKQEESHCKELKQAQKNPSEGIIESLATL